MAYVYFDPDSKLITNLAVTAVDRKAGRVELDIDDENVFFDEECREDTYKLNDTNDGYENI